jgi:hypothetical protein
MNRRAALRALALATLPAGCKATFPFTPTEASARTALQIHYGRAVRAQAVPGEFVSLRAYSVDVEEVFRDVTDTAIWTSSDPTIMEVRGRGLLQATRFGLVDVMVATEGATAAIRIEVGPSPSLPYLDIIAIGAVGIGFSNAWRAVMRGGTFSDVTAAASWTSSNPNVATATGGQITGITPGTVEITATYQTFSTTFRVSVEPQGRF